MISSRPLTLLVLAAAGIFAAPVFGQAPPAEQPPPPPEAPPAVQPPPPAAPAQPPPESAPPATSPPVNIEAPPEPSMMLQEPGAEPRRALRYDLPANVSQSTTVILHMSSTVTIDETEMPGQEIPSLELRMDVEVAGAGNGMYELQSELTSAGLKEEEGADAEPDMMAQMLNQAFGQLAGLRAVAQVDDRGVIKAIRTQPPEGIDPQIAIMAGEMEQPMTQIGIHFPEEEIGEGARWDVLIPSVTQGMTIQQTIEYELISLKDNIAEVRMVLAQSAQPQEVAGARLRSMSGEGTGTARVDLRRPAALKSEVEMVSRLEMIITEAGQQQNVMQTVRLQTSLRSEDRE